MDEAEFAMGVWVSEGTVGERFRDRGLLQMSFGAYVFAILCSCGPLGNQRKAKSFVLCQSSNVVTLEKMRTGGSREIGAIEFSLQTLRWLSRFKRSSIIDRSHKHKRFLQVYWYLWRVSIV